MHSMNVVICLNDAPFHRNFNYTITWGPRGPKFVKEIGRKIQEKTGNKNATSHIIQAISMTVQRGNTTSIMGTPGPLRKLEDFFDVIFPREEES